MCNSIIALLTVLLFLVLYIFAQLKDDARHLRQFVVAAALDRVNDLKWEEPSTHFKIVDKFDNLYVYAYVTQGGIQFALLSTRRDEQSVKHFFERAHELVVKCTMNPFFVSGGCKEGEGDGWILESGGAFDRKMRSISRVLG